jgi:predicted 3-demethylubiquinone-9 3-methyltransferase (glyoxalase superfamily)
VPRHCRGALRLLRCSKAASRRACGWLIDRYGVRWQIVPRVLDEMMADKDSARSKKVMDAMLKMVKLDIATLENAYRS